MIIFLAIITSTSGNPCMLLTPIIYGFIYDQNLNFPLTYMYMCHILKYKSLYRIKDKQSTMVILTINHINNTYVGIIIKNMIGVFDIIKHYIPYKRIR